MTKFTNTIFTALSYPDFNARSEESVGGLSSINLTASVYFANNNEDLDYNSLINTLEKLGISNLVVISITKKDTEIMEKEYKGDNTIIKNIIIPYNQFFTETGIKQFLIEEDFNITIIKGTQQKEIKPGIIIYSFEDTSWIEIKRKFKSLNISIGGGSNTKRHLLSSLHLKLSLFVLSLEKSNSFKKVWQSLQGWKIDKDISTSE
jgi:hypothetical protein